MRITTAAAFSAGIDSLQQRYSELNEANHRLTTGKRVERASDDPAAAARAERALASISRTDASQRAVQASRNAMTLTDTALADASDLLQQARETLVEAGNASYSDAERKVLAEKLSGLRAQLLGVANRGDGAGNYLFAGQGAGQAPFVDAAGGVQYRGGLGQSEAASGEVLPLNVNGEGAWAQARSGNGVFATSASSSGAWIDSGRVSDPAQLTGASYSLQFGAGGSSFSVLKDGVPTAMTGVTFVSGQAIEVDGMSFTITGSPADGDSFAIEPSQPELNVFDVFDRAIAELSAPNRSSTQITQTTQSSLRDLDGSMGALQALRSEVGESLNRADAVEGRLSAQKLYGQSERSDAEDLNVVEALSAFQNQQTGYQAALQAYSMVQKLSLFDYLG
jgi:flagellar hook-associated protein 3 FlgL